MIAVDTILVADAADALGVTSGRIRQLCIQKNIGKLRTPRLRILTKGDVRKLRNILSEPKQGRRRKNLDATA